MSRILDRRYFLALSAAGGLGLWAGNAPAQEAAAATEKRLRHACIGVAGMMGGGDVDMFKSHPRIDLVAMCDVDENHLNHGLAKAPGARGYRDWREMLEKEGDAIDSVNVTVPDHMHAIISLAALRKGKHVYCQKPMAHDVAGCRAMATLAAKSGLVTQLGTQHASGIGDQLAVHFLRQKVIGEIKRVILCSNRPGAEAYRQAGPRPANGDPVPAHLDWNLWTGVAPERPYANRIYHPGQWRSWQDFGTGWSGDIGCHIFSAVWKGLGFTAPKTVSARVQESWKNDAARRADTWPQSNLITWMFPGTEFTGPGDVTVEWFDGEFQPPEEFKAVARENGINQFPPEGAMVIGSEGSLLLPHGSGPQLFPREKYRTIERPQIKGPTHHHRFIDACLGGAPTESDFVSTGPMAETILLGTVAVHTPDTVLEWDAAKLCFPQHPAADALLRHSARKGWEYDLGV